MELFVIECTEDGVIWEPQPNLSYTTEQKALKMMDHLGKCHSPMDNTRLVKYIRQEPMEELWPSVKIG